MSSTSSCLASMTEVCLLRTCLSTYSLPTNIFWLSLHPHLQFITALSRLCDCRGKSP